MGTQKGTRRRYAKDLRNTLIYSSTAGLYCPTYLHCLKNGLSSNPWHKQGQENRYDPLWGSAPLGEKQVCPFFMLEGEHKGKINTNWIHLPSPLVPGGLSGLSPLQIYVMVVSPTTEHVQCLGRRRFLSSFALEDCTAYKAGAMAT